MSRFPAGVVVVGASAAGLSAADGLREGGYTGSITVLDGELQPGYDRPMLSKGLLQRHDDAEPSPLRSPDQLEQKQIDLLAGHAAMGLDIDRRLVVTNWGEAIPWEHVVIASGVTARPLRTLTGTPLPTLRDRTDLAAVRAIAAARGSVTLLGGGFVGLEVAAALRSRGLQVEVVDAATAPLAGVTGPSVAAWLAGLHRSHGVRLTLGHAIDAVEESEAGYQVHLDDGSTRPAAAVLAGLGTQPATDWLVGSGVTLAAGVLVDEAGRTDVPGVWAAGDVAAAPAPGPGSGHRRSEHWTHAIEHGRHIGLNIARGEASPYGAVPYVWTEHFGRTLHLLGERRPDDVDVLLDGDLGGDEFVVAHAGQGGDLHGVALHGPVGALRNYKKLLRAGATLDAARAAAVPS